jgi:hypothetical protein
VQALYALFFFALFGVAAWNVDLGLVSATQTRMQAAADASATMGLALEVEPASDASQQMARRARVREVSGRVLAAGVVPGRTPDGVPAAEIDALLPASNLENDPNGDLHHFAHDGAPAFRTSLRRISVDADPDAHRPGVRNAGAPLPLLFAAGSNLRFDAPGAPRSNGFAVGAAAIATARAAREVGHRIEAETGIIAGVTDFAVDVELWSRLAVGVAAEVRERGGTLFGIGTLAPGRGIRFGTIAGAARVGDRVPDPVPGGLTTIEDGFVPVYDSSSLRIVGFGRTSVAFDASTGRYRIAKAARSIAARNASAASTAPLEVAPPEWLALSEAFARNGPIGSGPEPAEPLLAIALSR